MTGSSTDTTHIMDCKVCGLPFDMRELDQVMAHEHDALHEATGIIGERKADHVSERAGVSDFQRGLEIGYDAASVAAVTVMALMARKLGCRWRRSTSTTSSGAWKLVHDREDIAVAIEKHLERHKPNWSERKIYEEAVRVMRSGR